jgi:hypothetical protein
MPSSNPLSQAVAELCQLHQATDRQGFSGQEAPLLRMLELAIGSDMGRGSLSGVGGANGVLNLGALELWQSIHHTVGEFWPGKGNLAMAKTHLIHRLELWTTAVANTDDAPHLLELCLWWASQVRDLLDPPKRVPIRGGQCPRCSEYQVLGTNPDGERVYVPCLLAHLSEEPVRVECLGCGGQWYDGNLLALALVNGVNAQ